MSHLVGTPCSCGDCPSCDNLVIKKSCDAPLKHSWSYPTDIHRKCIVCGKIELWTKKFLGDGVSLETWSGA